MFNHLIIMASAYSIGKRIALHYVDTCEKEKRKFQSFIMKYGRVYSISTHFLQTSSPSWDSIVKRDAFFKNVLVVDTEEEFLSLVEKDKELSALDVAKYITSKVRCTHLKLQKLVYMCYADYLCETGKKMFDDTIYAYRYGPVIDSIYKKYRRTLEEIEDNRLKYGDLKKELPIRSRIMVSEDGTNKLISIQNTLSKYGKLDAYDLVSLTHSKNTPWSVAGAGEIQDGIISDELIKRFHINEI